MSIFSRTIIEMAKKSKQSGPVRSKKKETLGILLVALCAWSIFCFFSYRPEYSPILNDPPIANSPSGFVGVWFAYTGLSILGIGGYLIPLILLFGSLMMTLRSYERAWPKWCWLFGGLICISSLFEYQESLWTPLVEKLNLSSPGGVMGQMLAIRTFGHWIGHVGAAIFFVAVLFLAILQLTGMHPFTPFRVVGKYFRNLYATQKKAHAARSSKKRFMKKEMRKKMTRPVGSTPDLFSSSIKPKPKTPTNPLKPSKPINTKPDDLPNHISEKGASDVKEPSYRLPPITILDELPSLKERTSFENTDEKSRILQSTLDEFGIDGRVTHIENGPTVTSYEITPAPGVRVERISSLERNISLALHAQSIRIQAPIPGKGVVGIEVPNTKSAVVYLRELAESRAFQHSNIALPLTLGKNVSGRAIIGDLASMPHLLIAGATGAGKTVCMNSLLTGLLLSRSPEQLRLILVDPKTFEFQAYENIKHLVVPIITDPKKVVLGLRWAIKEMEKRYALFKKMKVRDIKSFNSRTIEKQTHLFENDEGLVEESKNLIPDKLPYIVVVVDELAELMGVAQQEIEPCIVRLAQLSRASGIHMILATQRPSVNVITGTIKANIPGRIAFQVAQGNDSRTILDTIGAEKLLGKGDMLYLPPGKNKPIRLQGTWTSDAEMHRTTEFVRNQGSPEFITEIKRGIESNKPELPIIDENDDLLEAAIEVIRSSKRASTSSLQRRLRIGYNRAARLMDVLETKGIIGPLTETGPREILIDLDKEIPDHTGSELSETRSRQKPELGNKEL